MRFHRVWLLLGFILAATGCGGAHTHTDARSLPLSLPDGAGSLAVRFGAIRQSGDALGSPQAPYTLFEFADLQCPFCARFDRMILPRVIQQFVVPGLLRIEFHPIVLLGAASAPAGAATLAAGLQDRLWQFADLFYRNQGRENSGYISRSFIAWIGGAVPGLDVNRLERMMKTKPILAELVQNAALARSADVMGTPDFRLGHTGEVVLPFVHGVPPLSDFLSLLRRAIASKDRRRRV